MKFPLFLGAVFLVPAAAIAKDAPEPKPCPKGQVATTEKATGKRVCFEMSFPPMQPIMPLDAPKPAPKKP